MYNGGYAIARNPGALWHSCENHKSLASVIRFEERDMPQALFYLFA